MTKKDDEKVRVIHPEMPDTEGKPAVAHPRRADLQKWIDKGWQEQPATKETDK